LNLLLDDADEANGCLCFVPGSHHAGLLPNVPFDAPSGRSARMCRRAVAWQPVAVPVRAGQASIHLSHMLHGSGPNHSDRWRSAVVLNYMDAKTRVADDSGPLLRGVPWLPKGALVDGEHFPIVATAGLRS